MARAAILTLILPLISLYSFAETGNITGTIAQKLGEPLPGATIYLEGTNYGTVSRGSGEFIIRDVPAGKYVMVCTSIGFVTLRQTISVVPGKQTDLRIAMVESIQELPAVMVESVTLTGGMENRKGQPGSGFYLSPKTIRQFNTTDINRLLPMVPGVNITEEDGFGLRPNIGLRGTGTERSSKVTIMEDGILASPAPYTAPAAYYFPTFGRMYAAEVQKGSSQIKYGPFTTAGAINFLSTPIPDEFTTRLLLTGGSFGTRQMHAYAGQRLDRFGALVESFQYGSDGFKELDNGGNTGFRKSDHLVKLRVNSKADARVFQSLNVKAGWSTESSNETYLGLTRADFDATPYRRYAASANDLMTTGHRQLSARYSAVFSPKFEADVVVYRNDFFRNWYKLDRLRETETGSPAGISGVLANPGQYEMAMGFLTGAENSFDNALWYKANARNYVAQGVQASAIGMFKTGNFTHKVLGGLRLHQDSEDRLQYYDYYRITDGELFLTKRDVPGSESNRIGTADAFSGFVQYTLKYRRLTVVPGLRYEHVLLRNEDFGKSDPTRAGTDLKKQQNLVSAWIPGIAANWQVLENMELFGGIHKGFAPPGTREGTLPESSWNYEIGNRYSYKALSAEVVAYTVQYQNLLGADLAASGGAGTTELFNGGSAYARGVEALVRWDPLSSLSERVSLPLQLTYAYTMARFNNDFESTFSPWGMVSRGDEIPYTPHHQLTLLAGLKTGRWTVHLISRYVDAMRTVAGQGTKNQEFSTQAALLADASLQYQLKSRIVLLANLNNIANSTYIVADRPAGVRPAAPRMAMVGVRIGI